MKALIVDDEIKGAKTLHVLLREYCPQIEVAGMSHSMEDAESAIGVLHPDVVFLDIEMPDGSGFQLLERFPNHTFQVIFTTAYDHFAIQAFKTNAVSYLLKPIDADELKAAVKKLTVNDAQRDSRLSNIENALTELRAMSRPNQKLAVHSVDGISFIETEKIIRLEADSNYTHIFTTGGKKMTSAKTLKDYEEALPAGQFFRIHHAHIVNLLHVERYIKGEGGYIVTNDNTTLEVSRRRKAELLEVLGRM
ncbi:MAG: LytR/AlgR family response regulator transcription factor [Flavobacteriales bacterium]